MLDKLLQIQKLTSTSRNTQKCQNELGRYTTNEMDAPLIRVILDDYQQWR
jgi:hypothetical protein